MRGMPRRQRRRRGTTGALAATVVACAVLTGCGAPEHRFVTSADGDVVLEVPRDWSAVPVADVKAAGDGDTAADMAGWVAYFDAASRPSVDHVQASNVAEPVLVAQSTPLPEAAKAKLTGDMLRDVVYPVSANARLQASLLTSAGGAPKPRFRLIRERTISTPQARGVHLVFGYDVGRGEEVVDQIAVTDPARTRVHMLLVHCSTACFEARKDEISAVTGSFTVRPR